jgi:predicted MFS family arabinose efflux permease
LASEPALEIQQGPLPDRRLIVTVLGVIQIFAWGSTYYLPAVLAKPIAEDTGWSLAWIIGAVSLGMLTSGVAAPRVGRMIERHGGRPVLATSALLFAAGLAGLALSPNLIVYILAWIVIGVGMAAGLYDASFSTLGRIYGDNARQAITAVTLFGGLASTACWPLSAYLLETLGWRGACAAYAAFHLLLAAPAYLFLLPREAVREPHAAGSSNAAPPAPLLPFALFAAIAAVAAGVTSVLSMHLLTMLQTRDISLAAAVGLGALVGPAQVGARVVEMVIGRYHHPIWTLVASTVFVALGLALMWSGLPILSAALMIYGAGVGIHSIARGTLPLALFGPQGYATNMGRLARPALLTGAAAPTLGALLLEQAGTDATFATLFVFAVVNVIVTAALFAATAGGRRSA